VVLLRCRTLYNCTLEQRKTWWERGQGKSATYLQQASELPDLKAACPEYGEVHSQVLQDVLRRVEKTYHTGSHCSVVESEAWHDTSASNRI
jgi:putative transposase